MKPLLFAAILVSSSAVGQTADPAAAARKIRSEWESCVKMSVELWVAPQSDIAGPAESAFRNCNTEEQLIVSYAQAIAPENWGAVLAPFYKSKMDLKRQITDGYFKKLTGQIGKQ
jgi:hypothetical protein